MAVVYLRGVKGVADGPQQAGTQREDDGWNERCNGPFWGVGESLQGQ